MPATMAIILFWLGFTHLVLPAVERALIRQKGKVLEELGDLASIQVQLLKTAVDQGQLSEDSLKQVALNQLKEYRFGPGKQDYFWVHDTSDVVLMHPTMPGIVGRSLKEFPGPDNSYPVERMTRAAMMNGHALVAYDWQYLEDSSRVEPKISHVVYFKPWGWVIGNGTYLTDVKAEMATITSLLRKMGVGVSLLIIAVVGYMARYNYLQEERRREAEWKLRESVEELQEALERVRTLKGLLPICSRCKKVRDDSGYWQNVDAYISEHTDTEFSHGLCPDCHAEQLAELEKMRLNSSK